MNEQLNLLLGYMIMGSGTIILGAFIFNFLTNGFFLKYLSAKASRGKKVLVRIYSEGETYFKNGVISSGALVVTLRDKKKTELTLDIKKMTYRCMGVMCVDIDEENNVFLTEKNLSNEFDSAKYNHLLDRAINSPSVVEEKITRQILLATTIIMGLVICFGLFMLYNQIETIGFAVQALQSSGVVQ